MSSHWSEIHFKSIVGGDGGGVPMISVSLTSSLSSFGKKFLHHKKKQRSCDVTTGERGGGGGPEKHVVYNFDPIAIPKLNDLAKEGYLRINGFRT